MSGLKFKSEAEFARWRKSLPERPRLRVAASLGERVEVNETGARVVLTAVPARRAYLPSRAAVARAGACFFWAVAVAGMLGSAWCLGALWGMSGAGLL